MTYWVASDSTILWLQSKTRFLRLWPISWTLCPVLPPCEWWLLAHGGASWLGVALSSIASWLAPSVQEYRYYPGTLATKRPIKTIHSVCTRGSAQRSPLWRHLNRTWYKTGPQSFTERTHHFARKILTEHQMNDLVRSRFKVLQEKKDGWTRGWLDQGLGPFRECQQRQHHHLSCHLTGASQLKRQQLCKAQHQNALHACALLVDFKWWLARLNIKCPQTSHLDNPGWTWSSNKWNRILIGFNQGPFSLFHIT